MSESALRLVFAFGPRRGITLDVARPLTVGRAASCDVHLLDDKVSREHCVFERVGGGLQVRDLGSRNGTWVNGARLDGPRALKADDSVGIGETLVLVSGDGEALRTPDGDATVVLARAPLGLTTTASAPTDDVLSRAGRLLLEAALSSDARDSARRLARALAEGLGCDEVVLCRRTPEGGLRPLAASPAGASVSLNRALTDVALSQQRTVSVEEPQLRARHDEQTTTVLRQRAFVFCAPLPGRDGPVGVACGVRATAFDSEALALAQVLARAGTPALGLEREAGAPPSADVVAESAAMRLVVEQAQRVAPTTSTVLLTGPSGSGKEAIARLVHQASRRARGPFVAVNCGAIPGELAESELFGHEKGAFTGAHTAHAGVFERADGGTLFLDEVGELPLALQVKLLRVLEERLVTRLGGATPVAVDVRLLAATNRGLEGAVQQGSFREDLFYRLNVVRLALAPLHERPDDILPLARRFLVRHAAALGRAPPPLSQAAERALCAYPWPGNARQLGNALERALVLKVDDGPLDVGDLPPEVVVSRQAAPRANATLGELIAALEREHIVRAMKRFRGVKAQAAEALGISRPTLDRKLTEFAIDWVAEPEPR
ncbi:MAG: sigma 54-interacting transcriptional regulator [Myxococcaceae bacterium]|nr:sigma 54-interacting transcriptional regulator [Myxococcaceae bacterium]